MTDSPSCSLYLISKPTWQQSDLTRLEDALSTNKIAAFQLRLPEMNDAEVEPIAREVLEICHRYGVMFIVNNSVDLALKVGADGVHIGGNDGNVGEVRQKLGTGKVLGVSCYDSKDRALVAGQAGADYVSFGTFFPSTTKNSGAHPTPEILEWWSTATVVPCVAIGGINASNCAPLVKAGADFIAVVSAVWDHPDGVKNAVEELWAVVSVG